MPTHSTLIHSNVGDLHRKTNTDGSIVVRPGTRRRPPTAVWLLDLSDLFAAVVLLLSFRTPRHQNKLGLEEVPTLSYGGVDGGGDSGGGGGGDAPSAAGKKTIFKVKVTGFGDKAKIKVCGCVQAAYAALSTLPLSAGRREVCRW